MSTKNINNSKNANKQGKLLGKKHIFLLSIALLLLLFIILISPLFNMSEIQISNLKLHTNEEIELYFNEFKDKNGFIAVLENTTFSQLDGVLSGRITQKEQEFLFDHPLIKDATVSYDFPNTLSIKIEERAPAMLTETDEMYLSIDSEGYLLGAYTQKDRPDMPLIKGIDIEKYKVGASIADGSDKNIMAALDICSIMKQLSMLSYIDIIDVTDYNEIYMHCAPSLTVEFGGNDDVGRKLSYIKGIIDEGYDGNSDGILNVSNGGNPIFRENSDKEDLDVPTLPNQDESVDLEDSDNDSQNSEEGDLNDESNENSEDTYDEDLKEYFD